MIRTGNSISRTLRTVQSLETGHKKKNYYHVQRSSKDRSEYFTEACLSAIKSHIGRLLQGWNKGLALHVNKADVYGYNLGLGALEIRLPR